MTISGSVPRYPNERDHSNATYPWTLSSGVPTYVFAPSEARVRDRYNKQICET